MNDEQSKERLATAEQLLREIESALARGDTSAVWHLQRRIEVFNANREAQR